MNIKQIFITIAVTLVTATTLAHAASWKAKRVQTGLEIANSDGSKCFTIPLTFATSRFFKPTVVVSKDRQVACVANGINETSVWHIPTQKKLLEFDSPVTPLRFNSNGTWLAVRETDGTFEFWNTEKRKLQTLPDGLEIKSLTAMKFEDFNDGTTNVILQGTISELMEEEDVKNVDGKILRRMPKAWVTTEHSSVEFVLVQN